MISSVLQGSLSLTFVDLKSNGPGGYTSCVYPQSSRLLSLSVLLSVTGHIVGLWLLYELAGSFRTENLAEVFFVEIHQEVPPAPATQAPVVEKVQPKLEIAKEPEPIRESAKSQPRIETQVAAASSNLGTADFFAAEVQGVARARYDSVILARLEKVKRYPARARDRGLEGEVVLLLELSRDGGVYKSEIRKSSGFELFDNEVLAMVVKAEPFPEVPAELASDSLEFLIPINFKLREARG